MATVLERPRFITPYAGDYIYTLKRGIPLPPRKTRIGVCKYPFAHMGVGDCFDVPVSPTTESASKTQTKLAASARSYAQRHGGKFATRSLDEDGGIIRVWRTA